MKSAADFWHAAPKLFIHFSHSTFSLKLSVIILIGWNDGLKLVPILELFF
jgi:hypothetical protein